MEIILCRKSTLRQRRRAL